MNTEIGKIFVGMGLDKTAYTKGLKEASVQATNFKNIFSTIKNTIIAIGVGKLLKDSITSGINAIESENLFEVAMGNMSKSARKWSEELRDQLGLNSYEVRKNVGVLYNMTKSMGLGEQASYDMSTGLTKLAYDMASFYNLSPDEAFIKLRSGIVGEVEPLRQLGITVDENTVKQIAYANGIGKVGKELNQQQKIAGRYLTIMSQTSNAQGDLARTINSPANQLRILNTRFQEFKTTLGMTFVPLLNIVLPAFSGFLIGISSLITGFNNLNPMVKIFLGVMVASALLIPFVTFATKTLISAKILLAKVYEILTVKATTFSMVLKGLFLKIALLAGAVAILLMIFGGTSKNTKKVSEVLGTTSLTANKASSSIKGLSDSMDELKKSTSFLASFDQINNYVSTDENGKGGILGLTGNELSNLEDISSELGDINKSVKELNILNLDGLVGVLKNVWTWVTSNKDALLILGGTLLGVFGVAKITTVLTGIKMLIGGAGIGLLGLSGILLGLAGIGVITFEIVALVRGLNDLKAVNEEYRKLQENITEQGLKDTQTIMQKRSSSLVNMAIETFQQQLKGAVADVKMMQKTYDDTKKNSPIAFLFTKGQLQKNVDTAKAFADGLRAQIKMLGAVPKYASGGQPPLNQVSLVGERGPELFVPNQRGTVISNEDLKNILGNSSSDRPLNITLKIDEATFGKISANSINKLSQQRGESVIK